MRYYRYNPAENQPHSFSLKEGRLVEFLAGEVLLLDDDLEIALLGHPSAQVLIEQGKLKAYSPLDKENYPESLENYRQEDAEGIISGSFDIDFLTNQLDNSYPSPLKQSLRAQIEKLKSIGVQPYSKLPLPSAKLMYASRIYRDIVRNGENDLNLAWKRQYGMV